MGVNLLAVLEWDQHLVHQGHGQVRRHQGGGSGCQCKHETQEQLALVGLGETPQTKQAPGGSGCIVLLGFASAAGLFGVAQRCVAVGTPDLPRSGTLPGLEFVEARQQARGLQVVAQGEAPFGELLGGIAQLQLAHPRMITQLELPVGLQRQALPGLGGVGGLPKQALGGENQQAACEIQCAIEVNLQPRQDVFFGRQLKLQVLPPRSWQIQQHWRNK